MAVTSIITDEAYTATDSIKTKLANQLEIIDSYSGFIPQLQANWSGEGCAAFIDTYTKLAPDIRKMLSEMNEYNEEIIKLLNKMQEIDINISKLFDAV